MKYHRNKRLEQLYNFELLKENPCIPYNVKETQEEKK